MIINPLISAIIRHRWAIDPQYALNAGPIISGILSGNDIIQEKEEKLSAAVVAVDRPGSVTYYNWDSAPAGSVALIKISGELLKGDMGCGHVGMATIGQRIKKADQDSRFSGILLQIDSPGGTVDGTETLGNIIRETKKPILSFVDGLMASSALWVGSSADEVWASTDTDEVGSIGVLMSFADMQPYYEKMGVKFHLVTASTSEEKVKLVKDLKAGDYQEYIKKVLDPLDKKFMDTVKTNRRGVKESHLTGKVFFAKEVMGSLVDEIGTLEEAIQRVANMSSSGSKFKSNNSKTNMKKFALINQVLGIDSLEMVEGYASLSEEQMSLLEAAMEPSSEEQNAADVILANKVLREENESLKKAAAGGSALAITDNDKTGEDPKSSKDGSIVSQSDDFVTGLNKIREELKK